MSQDYVLPLGTDTEATALATRVPACLEALRSLFSGGTEPTAKTPYQLWADTTSGWVKIRNAANTDWIKAFRLASALVQPVPGSQFVVPSLSGTTTLKLGAAPRAGTVLGVVILGETASSSSSGNEWRPMLRKRTVATPGSTVDLFSGAVGTFTSLSGVYTAGEFVAHKAAMFLANQNAGVDQHDVLELVMTELGAATTLANVSAWALME